jgi:molybdopterin-guanine dinucleotide biosynthesis protein MobB
MTPENLLSIIEQNSNCIAFCAPSGTGKTTYLCSVIPGLQSLLQSKGSESGIKVIKMSHHPIDVNTTNKDCQRYRNLGVEVLVSNCIQEAQYFIKEHVRKKQICLVEGGRRLNLPSIILSREDRGFHNWIPPKNILFTLNIESN